MSNWDKVLFFPSPHSPLNQFHTFKLTLLWLLYHNKEGKGAVKDDHCCCGNLLLQCDVCLLKCKRK